MRLLPLTAVVATFSVLPIACGGELGASSVPAKTPPTSVVAQSRAERCGDSCSSSYDQCSNGCLNMQLSASLQGFGNEAAVGAAGDQSQGCLDSCNASQEACSSRCDQIADSEAGQQGEPSMGVQAPDSSGDSVADAVAKGLAQANAQNAAMNATLYQSTNGLAGTPPVNVNPGTPTPRSASPASPPAQAPACTSAGADDAHTTYWWAPGGKVCPTYGCREECAAQHGGSCVAHHGSASPAC